jgi:hypothetical protein
MFLVDIVGASPGDLPDTLGGLLLDSSADSTQKVIFPPFSHPKDYISMMERASKIQKPATTFIDLDVSDRE